MEWKITARELSSFFRMKAALPEGAEFAPDRQSESPSAKPMTVEEETAYFETIARTQSSDEGKW